MQTEKQLTPNLSITGAWAFAVGTSIGWGSLVVTNNAYLAQAGPAGSVIGLVIGALIMLVISRNYAYLMNCYPNAGGAYTFCREIFGYDYGFLTAWFLALTYLAILWANATSLPLFIRYFMGYILKVGKLYQVFGYNVFLGEALLSIGFILAVTFLCARSRDLAAKLMICLVALFFIGIVACFCGAVFQLKTSIAPSFIPENNALGQIMKISVMSSWAFIGFESISHATEEFSFSKEKSFRVLLIVVITTTLLYGFVMLLSVTAYPARYGDWLEYIRDLNNLSGIEALPAFYAANHYLGGAGMGLLMVSLLALILTSLIGNVTALSRLFYSLGKDGILPASVGRLCKWGTPARAMLLIAGVSVLIPFLGRVAIGWIVDVTMLGATMTYGFVSAAAYKEASFRNDPVEMRTGLIGLVIMVGFGLYLLVPNLFVASSMESESYFLFVAWSVMGFFVFRTILKHDQKKHFGKSIIVWIAFLSLILFVSLVWMNQSIMNVTDTAMRTVESFYADAGISGTQTDIVSRQMAAIRSVTTRSVSVVVLLFMLSLAVLLNNYRLMASRQNTAKRSWAWCER